MPSNSYKKSSDKGALSAYYGEGGGRRAGDCSDADECEPLVVNRRGSGSHCSVLRDGGLWTQEEATEQAKVVSQGYRDQVDKEMNLALDSETDEEAAVPALSYEEYHAKVDKIWENTDWEATGDEKKYGLTSMGAVCSLLAAIFGVGILEQPKAVQQSGFAMGMLALILSTVVSYFGGYYLGIAARMTAKKSLGEISKTAGGVFGVILSVYSLLGLCILASIGYAVSWYRYTAEIWVRAKVWTPEQIESTAIISPRSLVITVLLAIIYPVCCMRDLSALNVVSTAAAGVYLALVFMMGYYWISDYLMADKEEWGKTIRKEWTPQVESAPPGSSTQQPVLHVGQSQAGLSALNHPCQGMFDYELVWGYSGDWKALFFGLALMNTAFACHFSCVDVFAKELQKPTRKVLHTVLGWTMGISIIVYGVFTGMGWSYASKFQYYKVKANLGDESFDAMCQQGAQDKILGNMKEPGMEFDPPLVAVAQFIVFLVLFLTYPLFISASRSTIHGLIWGEKPSSCGLHMLETGALVLLTWVLAIFIPGVTTILAYAGAGPGVALVLILPSYLMLCLHKHLPWCSWNRLVPLILLIMGVIVSIGGVALTALESKNLELGANVPISSEWPEINNYRKLNEPVLIHETADVLFQNRDDSQVYWYDYEPANSIPTAFTFGAVTKDETGGEIVPPPTPAALNQKPTIEQKPVSAMEKLIRYETVSRIVGRISAHAKDGRQEGADPRLGGEELESVLKFVRKKKENNKSAAANRISKLEEEVLKTPVAAQSTGEVPDKSQKLVKARAEYRQTAVWWWTEKVTALVNEEMRKIRAALAETSTDKTLNAEDRKGLTENLEMLQKHGYN